MDRDRIIIGDVALSVRGPSKDDCVIVLYNCRCGLQRGHYKLKKPEKSLAIDRSFIWFTEQ
jgi:hypothetical protein